MTEQGRQPWVAEGLLRTEDAMSPLAGWTIALSLTLFVVIYAIIFATGIYFMNRLIVRGPDATLIQPPAHERPTCPIAAAHGEGQMTPEPDRGAQEDITMEWYLPVIWGLIIGVAVIMYVVLDGFDLGIGILFPFAKEEKERDVMMNTVAPFWDGNETWLVLGGGGLWVAFPKAYAVVMPALYLPVIIMLLALVFRGVAFEFRWVAATSRRNWNLAFTGARWWRPSPRVSFSAGCCRASR